MILFFIQAPSNYDYLDDSSLLKLLFNQLITLMSNSQSKKSNLNLLFQNDSDLDFLFFIKDSSDPIDGEKIRMIISILTNSVKSSESKVLPPVNWFYIMTLLFKTHYGKIYETKLIEITLHQSNYLNSARLFLKNILIDTNYFLQMKVNQKF